MIETIKKEVNECAKCPNLLHCKANGMAPAIMEHSQAKILFILQNPGVALEDEKGKSYESVLWNSLQGQQFLAKFLGKMGLTYADICWSNICKCPSPDNRPLEKEEMDNCFPFLQRQIDLLPELTHIVIMGKQAIDYIKEHPLKLKEGIKLVNFFHPSYIFRIGRLDLIDELVEKIKPNFIPKEIIQVQNTYNTIYEFYRDIEGNKRMKVVDFNNYFYVRKIDLERVKELIENIPRKDWQKENGVINCSSGYVSLYGEELVRIVPNKFEFWKIKKLLKESEIFTYEYTLDVVLKYLLSNPKKFSPIRKLGLIDIETDMSLDAKNAPEPITSITLYDYSDENYYTWILQNPSKQLINLLRENPKEKVFIFEDEKGMLSDFMDRLKLHDFDIIGGWYSNDFDWPYIYNRLKKLDMDYTLLSKFGQVECREFTLHTKHGIRTGFDVKILGLELIDFIPVLQKNTCYSSQPSSWSLESCSKFYLENDEKLVKIGADAWKKDINSFITYNIKDVELVKKIIDKFKLLDFLIMIQSEVAPVQLSSTYHNSVVLLYYLKFLFPYKILRDNPGWIDLAGDKINLEKFKVRMKAAHVIKAIPGIHDNVSIFDFAGLYPSIFRTFNISPETVGNIGEEIDDIAMWKVFNVIDKEGEDDDDFDKNKIIKEFIFNKKYKQDTLGVYPLLLKNLVEKREGHKAKRKEYIKLYGENDIRVKLEMFRQDVLKQINNSLYGVGGFNKTILFNPIISASVTSISRKLIKYVEEYVNKKEGFVTLSGDTDSLFIKHPKSLNPKEFEKELNAAIKEFVNFKWPNLNKDNYCFNFEYAKTFSKFVMKDAKKKYYGILQDGSFYVKGFSLIQHVLHKKIKDIIQEIYILLLEKKDGVDVRNRIYQLKKEFFKFPYEYLTQELRLANDPDKYSTNVRHARAAFYSNKYLGTHFKAGSTGRLLMIKDVKCLGKYPKTDVLFLDEDTSLPFEFTIDYELAWQKLVLDNIQLLESVDEMKISHILNKNKCLFEFT
jgi:DNA polymerase II